MTPVPPPPEDVELPPEAEAARAKKINLIRRRWSRRRVGTAGFLAMLALIVLGAATIRLGVLTDPGRAMVTRLLDRQQIGRFGQLRVEGLQGDVFGDFRVARLTILDAKGAWLDARNVALRWSPLELILRRFHVRRLSAGVLEVLRRPELTPDKGGPGGPIAVSIRIDALNVRLKTRPAFSVRDGDWDVAGQADIRRNGKADGRLDAKSRLHVGDGVQAAFNLAPKGRMQVRIDAVEASGGALAGAMGMPAAERLFVHGRVDSSTEESGTLSLVTESGPRRPLTANGSWGKGGASLDAQLLLDASSLSADYAAKAGPQVHITLKARPAGGDLFEVDAAARARDATVLAKGPVDWRRRTSTGLALQLSVVEFKRWLSDLHAGPAQMTGLLTGSLDRWRYAGRAQLERIDQLGYRLARGSGPVTLAYDKGEFRLQLDAATAGGAGEGLTPVLLGPSPHIRLDGSRLPGGRILIRDLAVEGAGLTLKAAGDRSILGVLSLKGDLALSKLERAHPGAKGVVRAAWTARQSGHDPWRISADAHGEGFATGYPEVDRLLGPAPKLEGEASYGQDLTITRSQITGAAVQAGVRGVIDAKAVLALDVDWRARGPFTIGPVEIAGEAVGTGKVTGPAITPAVDLAADLASIDFGRLVLKPAHLSLQVATEGGLNGQIGLSGPSEWGQAVGKAHFRFTETGVDLTEIAADAGGVKASGALALRDGAPSTADLSVNVGPGAFLAGGKLAGVVKIQERAGGATAQITLDGQNLTLPGVGAGLKTLRLRANGPFARLPIQVAAEAVQPFAWRFAGDGVLTQTGAGAAIVREVSLTGSGRVRRADLRTAEPLVVRLGPAESTVRARMAVGTGRAGLDARQAGDALEAKGQAEGIDLSGFAYNYIGKLSGALALTGRGARLDGSADAAIEGGRDRDAPADVALSAKVHAALADTRMKIDASATNPQGLTAKLDLDLPAEATAAPFRIALVRNRPLTGSFNAAGELRPLWDLFAGSARTLSGRGTVQATLAGDLNGLKPTGQAAIEGGRFQDSGTGLDLRNLGAQATFDLASVNVRRFTGDDGHGGQLSGSGTVSLAPDGASNFSLDLKAFRLVDNDLARASASGQITVTRDAAGKAKLAGTLTIDRADVTAKPPIPNGVVPLEVIEINRPGDDGETEAAVRSPGGPQIALDVSIRATRGVFIKGNGLDAELSVAAHVGGTTAEPDLTGTAHIVRGDYQFAGKRFEFDDRGVIRLGSHPEQIRLDLTATREDPTLRAIVRIIGTAAKPEITLSSSPVLPQDEVLSQVLFGRSAAQLTPLEAAQLASAVAALATGGGFDVLGNLRQFARLDRLAVSGGGGGAAATVSGGKYLTDDVYLELTGGGRQGSSAQVEWRVRRNFSIVSTVGVQGDARLSVRFRHNY